MAEQSAQFDGVLARGAEALLFVDHPVKIAASTWASESIPGFDAIERDHDSEFTRSGWKACAEYGLQRATVPTAFGGDELDTVTALLMFEGLGHGCADAGLAFAVSCQTWAMLQGFLAGANDDQKQRYLPGIASGDLIGAFAMSELESGSDSYSLATTATQVGSNFVLNGRKAWVTAAPIADFVVLFATTDPELGRWGISAFVVPMDLPGITVETRTKMGMRTTPFGDIVLDDVEVPEAALLGAIGSGGAVFNEAVASERAFLFATQIGAMERQLDQAIGFANDREQFGQSIGRFQAVSHRIADMVHRHETARILLYKTALEHRLGRPSTATAAMTKLSVSEGAVASGVDAVMLHGARGYVTSFGVEQQLRDAVGSLVYSGTSDIQRNIIARLKGVRT